MIMERNENNIEVLNDLIRINNDRVAGYEKAIDETKDIDADLRGLFSQYANESRQYASELRQLVVQLGGNPADDTTVSGKIYRVWMDLKVAITGKDRKTVLSNCEFGEDAAQKAYNTALETDDLSPEVRELIVTQKGTLKQAHDLIKNYRDMHPESR
jgi:uncharacterized protein (TIGR02284 family)